MLTFPIICEKENVGTGDYKISNVNKNEIQLSNIKKVKQLTIKIYDNAKKLYDAFNQKDVDVITTQSLNYKNYVGEMGYNKIRIYGRNFEYLKFNQESKIISNPEVIQSISYAINKNEIINKIYNNVYIQAEFPLQYGSYLYKNNIIYDFNISKAKKVLENAGWKYNGTCWEKDKHVLRLNILTNIERKEFANIIKENLELIGIKVSLVTSDNEYYRNLRKLNYDILVTGNIMAIKPEIQNFLNFEIEKKSTPEETYANIYEKFQKQPSFMGICFDSITVLYSKKIKGNLKGNWYNIFYNIDTWYKMQEN